MPASNKNSNIMKSKQKLGFFGGKFSNLQANSERRGTESTKFETALFSPQTSPETMVYVSRKIHVSVCVCALYTADNVFRSG